MIDRLIHLFQSRVIRISPVAVLILTLGLTAAATYSSFHIRLIQRESRAREMALTIANGAQERLISYQSVLVDTRSFLTAVTRADGRDFSRFVDGLDLETNYPALMHVGYARGDGTKATTVRFAAAQNGMPAANPELLRTASALTALALARDTGEATLSVMGEKRGAPLVMFLPVYEIGLPLATPDMRRAAVRGFVFASFAPDEFFKNILLKEFAARNQAHVEIYDQEPATPRLIYRSEGDQAASGLTRSEVRQTVGGHDWSVTVTASPRALGESGWPGFIWVLLVGSSVSLLIYLYSMTASRYAVSLEQSQSLISLIANSLPALVAYVDNEHRYRYVNRAYLEWFGLAPGDLLGKRVGGLMGPRYEKFFRPLVERALNGERLEFEYSLEHKGQMRAMRSQYIPDFDGEGEVAGFVGLVSDVTEQKAFQDRLRDERRISELVNEVGLSLQAVLDVERLFQRITDVATELTGAEAGLFFYTAEGPEDDGKAPRFTVSGPMRRQVKDITNLEEMRVFKPAFDGGRSVRLDDISEFTEYRTLRRFNARSYLAVPVISRSKEILGGLIFIHSRKGMFTERAEKLVSGIAAQASVAIDNATLYGESQAVNRVKDEFLATLSHELRTPMNVILGYSELLSEEEGLPPNVRAHIEAIHRNARAQNQLIADLLDISAIITGKLSFLPQRVNSSVAVRAAVENLRFSAEAKGVGLMVDIDEGCPINGDPTRLQQIVWNLLSNAIKFTPAGGKVGVRSYRSGAQCVVEVRDSGIGIDTEFLPYVFDRFRQEDSGHSRKYGGLGLGLSIVRQLVEMHGGSIRVESVGKNQGTTFTVTLPLAVAELQAGP